MLSFLHILNCWSSNFEKNCKKYSWLLPKNGKYTPPPPSSTIARTFCHGKPEQVGKHSIGRMVNYMSSSVEGFSTIFCDFKNYTNYVRSGMFLEVKLRKVFKFGRALTAQAQHIFLFFKSHEK